MEASTNLSFALSGTGFSVTVLNTWIFIKHFSIRYFDKGSKRSCNYGINLTTFKVPEVNFCQLVSWRLDSLGVLHGRVEAESYSCSEKADN